MRQATPRENTVNYAFAIWKSFKSNELEEECFLLDYAFNDSLSTVTVPFCCVHKNRNCVYNWGKKTRRELGIALDVPRGVGLGLRVALVCVAAEKRLLFSLASKEAGAIN